MDRVASRDEGVALNWQIYRPVRYFLPVDLPLLINAGLLKTQRSVAWIREDPSDLIASACAGSGEGDST